MSCSEAGKLGALASKATCTKQKLKRREKYNTNPVLCLFCATPIPYEKRSSSKFCGHSCAATYHNSTRIIDKHKPLVRNKNCLSCSKKLSHTHRIYCFYQCEHSYKWEKKKQKLLATGTDWSPDCKNARRYLLETKGPICDICKGAEWFGNPMPLTLDHINGNPEDNSLINLRVICPNCDRFTPFFGSKNRGNGRANRRKRYQEGKSY